jgi:hypothetical protein
LYVFKRIFFFTNFYLFLLLLLENSLNCWGSFEQLYLFQLIKAEIGNKIEKIENFISSSLQLRVLEPIGNIKFIKCYMRNNLIHS